MTIDKLINKLAEDTNIFFYRFEQEDGTIIAKSHFFDFHFGNTDVKIVNSYNMPGPLLQQYLDVVVPISFTYDLDNFYDVMLQYVEEMHDNCIKFERREND